MKERLRMKKQSWYIYIVSCNFETLRVKRLKHEFFKIGITKNVKKRVMGIQNGCPILVKLVLSIELKNEKEAREIEAVLHKKFQKQRMMGEWFFFYNHNRHNLKLHHREIQSPHNRRPSGQSGIAGSHKITAVRAISLNTLFIFIMKNFSFEIISISINDSYSLTKKQKIYLHSNITTTIYKPKPNIRKVIRKFIIEHPNISRNQIKRKIQKLYPELSSNAITQKLNDILNRTIHSGYGYLQKNKDRYSFIPEK